jgi:hypothetical protein
MRQQMDDPQSRGVAETLIDLNQFHTRNMRHRIYSSITMLRDIFSSIERKKFMVDLLLAAAFRFQQAGLLAAHSRARSHFEHSMAALLWLLSDLPTHGECAGQSDSKCAFHLVLLNSSTNLLDQLFPKAETRAGSNCKKPFDPAPRCRT